MHLPDNGVVFTCQLFYVRNGQTNSLNKTNSIGKLIKMTYMPKTVTRCISGFDLPAGRSTLLNLKGIPLILQKRQTLRVGCETPKP